MTKKERIALKTESEAWFDYTHDIFTYAMDELEQKKQVKKVVTALVQREEDPDNEFPEGWFTLMVDSYILGEAYMDTAMTRKLLRKASEGGDRKVKELLDIWSAHPMRWSPFQIEEQLGEDLYTIYDFEEDKQELLYSPGVTTMLRSPDNRDKLQVVLRGYTGSCWITYGAFHDFHLTAFDLVQWATLLDKTTYESKGFSACVQRNFLDFFAIDEIMLNPVIGHRGEILRRCMRLFDKTNLDESLLPGTWKKDSSGAQLLQLQFAGLAEHERETIQVPKQDLDQFHKTSDSYWETGGMRFPTIYYHSGKHKLVLESLTASGYDVLYRLLKASQPDFDIDDTGRVPSWEITSSLDLLIRRQPHIKTPWQEFVEPFMNEAMMDNEIPYGDDPFDHDSNEAPADMNAVNVVLKEIQVAHNKGIPFDKEDACQKSGLDLKTVSSLFDNFLRMMGKMDFTVEIPPKDVQSILTITEPSPHAKHLFQDSLFNSSLFTVHDDEGPRDSFDVLTGGKFNSSVMSMGLKGVVSDLFFNAFDREDTTVMNSVFYLLKVYGEQWVPVRSYAVTILKWFSQVLLLSQGHDYDTFIEHFSTFMLRKLCTHAICEVQGRPTRDERVNGTYHVRTTIFFDDFIELKKPLN